MNYKYDENGNLREVEYSNGDVKILVYDMNGKYRYTLLEKQK